MTISEALSEFISGMEFTDLPLPASEKASSLNEVNSIWAENRGIHVGA